MLALVAGQDVEPAEGSDGTDGRWRIARKVAPDRVISTVDPEARHAHKTRERKQDGFKAHVAVEPDTGLITAAALTKATGPDNSDAAVGGQLLDADPTMPEQPDQREPLPSFLLCQHPGRRGAGPGRLGLRHRGDARRPRRPGHTPVIKPWPLRPAVRGGFTIADFTVDEAAGTVTCPNDVTRTTTRTRAATFGARLHRLPAAGPLHHRATGRNWVHRRARRPAARPPRTGHRPGLPSRSTAGTGRWSNAHRLAHPRQSRLPLPRRRQERRLVHPRVAAINLRRLLTLGLRYDAGDGPSPDLGSGATRRPRTRGLDPSRPQEHARHGEEGELVVRSVRRRDCRKTALRPLPRHHLPPNTHPCSAGSQRGSASDRRGGWSGWSDRFR